MSEFRDFGGIKLSATLFQRPLLLEPLLGMLIEEQRGAYAAYHGLYQAGY
jgi:hypothetical protein